MKIIAITLALIATLHAQDLAPELAPIATKYKTDVASLETQRTAAIARVQQPYTAALDTAERTATAGGNLNVVAAITKERGAVKDGLMAPALPPELPKSLGPARQAYLNGAARVDAEIVAKQKTSAANYLRALAALQPKAAGNAELAKQIATEKERLLGIAGAATAPKAQGISKNAVTNGTFDLAEADGRPKGWTTFGPVSADTFKVVRDGSNSVLRLTVVGASLSVGATQHIPIPERAKTIIVSGRIRGKLTDAHKNDSNHGANIGARQVSEEDKEVGMTIIRAGTAAGWKSFKQSTTVKNGAKQVNVACIGWWVSGTFDFDDIEVEFR